MESRVPVPYQHTGIRRLQSLSGGEDEHELSLDNRPRDERSTNDRRTVEVSDGGGMEAGRMACRSPLALTRRTLLSQYHCPRYRRWLRTDGHDATVATQRTRTLGSKVR